MTTDLTIYRFLSAAEKTLFFFLPTKPLRNPRKKRSDHSFYHRQTRNTRKQWTKNAPRASALEQKRYESTQSAREDRPTSVGVVEAARSSRVTQTKKPSSFVQDAQIWRLFLSTTASFCCFCTIGSFLLRSLNFASPFFYEFSTNLFRNSLRTRSERRRNERRFLLLCGLEKYCLADFKKAPQKYFLSYTIPRPIYPNAKHR